MEFGHAIYKSSYISKLLKRRLDVYGFGPYKSMYLLTCKVGFLKLVFLKYNKIKQLKG